MEIAYKTGAKVILQGPCTYEVDSPTGGFLSLGKLTARVEKGEGRGESVKSEIRNPKSEIPNPSPLSPLPSPLFSVRTPTAVVTDLGTEFGVEVSKGGTTISHVFRGSVRVHTVAADGRQEEIVLREDESARSRKRTAPPLRGWCGTSRRVFPHPSVDGWPIYPRCSICWTSWLAATAWATTASGDWIRAPACKTRRS